MMRAGARAMLAVEQVASGRRTFHKPARSQQQALVESDLNINSLINWLFNLAFWLAFWLDTVFVGRRICVPLGISLLAIATRPSDTSNPWPHA